MRKKKQNGERSVQAIAGTHVVLLGMDLPEPKCPGLLGFAFDVKITPKARSIGYRDIKHLGV